MVAVIFPDGTRLEGATWADLERQLREDSWNPSDERELREEFAHRARVWSGTQIALDSSPERFFEDLERAGLLMIERDEL
jgi:hypothetical protein